MFRILVLLFLVAVCGICLATSARSQQQAPTVVAQAPPVQVCECAVTGVCTCPPGACDCPACDPYTVARLKAVRENKPLIAWRGWTCPSCITHLTRQGIDAVHVSVLRTDPRFGDLIPEGVIVSVPDGEGGLDVVAEIPPGQVEERIAESLKPKEVKVYTTVPFGQAYPTTPTTGAITVVHTSTAYPVTTWTAPIPMFVPGVVMHGNTNCGTSG